MNESIYASRVSLLITKNNLTQALQVIKSLGFNYIDIESGRTVLRNENRNFLQSLHPASRVIDNPISIISMTVPAASTSNLINMLVSRLSLDIPGRGSVFAQNIKIHAHHPAIKLHNYDIVTEERRLASDLFMITAIVQMDDGNPISLAALETGAGLPYITYGTGSGFRDKLGLWRITIPAAKEIMQIVVSSNDVNSLMNIMIDAGGLDKPGRGFIYYTPVAMGWLDTKISYGATRHAASQEQIIAAIDDLKGNMLWRRREISARDNKRQFLRDMIRVRISCNEGHIQELTNVAMHAGAGGATLKLIRNHSYTNEEESVISHAREEGILVIQESHLEKILDALLATDFLSDEVCGFITSTPVPKACTYMPK